MKRSVKIATLCAAVSLAASLSPESGLAAEPGGTENPAPDAAMVETVAAAKSLETRAREALARGSAYLIAQQQEGGHWSDANFPALTGLPLWALALENNPQNAAALAKAAQYIASCIQPDGGIYVASSGGARSLGTYNTAICMTALHAYDKEKYVRIIQKAREFMATTQLLGADEYRGGFGYDRDSGQAYADLNNTTWALSAMRLTQDVEEQRPAGETKVDVDWDAALEFISKLQLDTTTANETDAGGFIYKPEDDKKAGVAVKDGKPYLRSFGSITYSGLLSMIYAQVSRDDPRVVSAVDYARRHWTLDENPGMGIQGIYYYYTIMARSLAATGLKVLPARAEAQGEIAWSAELLERLLVIQKEDGSWVNSNNRFWEANPILTTAYSILALQNSLATR